MYGLLLSRRRGELLLEARLTHLREGGLHVLVEPPGESYGWLNAMNAEFLSAAALAVLCVTALNVMASSGAAE